MSMRVTTLAVIVGCLASASVSAQTFTPTAAPVVERADSGQERVRDCQTLERQLIDDLEQRLDAAYRVSGDVSHRDQWLRARTARSAIVSNNSNGTRLYALRAALSLAREVERSAMTSNSSPIAAGRVDDQISRARSELGVLLGNTRKCEASEFRKISFLPEASLTVGNAKPDLGLQVTNLFFSDHWRFYLRTTLPLTDSSPETPGTDAPGGGTAQDDSKPADRIRSALLDPYGGVLYATMGHFRKLSTS